jgi:hypothetical protein
MNDALTDLRENGEIPWGWIVDETRSIEDYTGFSTIQEGALTYLEHVRLSPWNGEKIPFVLTESRSLAGVLRGVCQQYGVRIAPTNGQCGGFLHTEVAPTLKAGQSVLYLGDFDLCGNDIESNTRRVLEREAGKLDWERLALSEEQVSRYDLPRITKNDRRFKNGRGIHQAVETEALSQRIIVDILHERLEQMLPEALENVEERAEEQRAMIRQRIEMG